MSAGEWLLRIALFAVATASLHYGLGLALWLSAVIGVVLALLGTLLIVVVLDGDGGPW